MYGLVAIFGLMNVGLSYYWTRTLAIVSSALFVVCLTLSAHAISSYPGGSKTDEKEAGFNMKTNYWCELYRPIAINGDPNPGMLSAKLATLFGSWSLLILLVAIPEKLKMNHRWRRCGQVSGIIAALLALFMFTGMHDITLLLGSVFGIIALGIIVIGLRKSNLTFLFWVTILFGGMILLNNIIYFGFTELSVLAIIQKITIIIFILLVISFYLLLWRKPIKTSVTNN